MARRSYVLWGLLGLAGAMYLTYRTKEGRTVIADAVDELSVRASRAGEFIARLGDWARSIPDYLKGVFERAAAVYTLPDGLLESVAYQESRFRPDIIDGTTRSSAGAVGIMQIVPRWHPEIGEAGAADPERAIPYAAKYLRSLYERFGSWRLALAAYNWGPTNVAADRTGASWPAETRAYVSEVTNRIGLA